MRIRPRRIVPLLIVVAVAAYAGVATQLEQRALRAQSADRGTAPNTVVRVAPDALMADLVALSSPDLEGRRTSTEGGRHARDLVRARFTSLGLQPAGSRGFDQPFSFVHSSIKGLLLPGRPWKTGYGDAANLIARVPGRSSASRALLISAHYDHLGVQDGAVYPGADDNASGVAAMLAVARYVQARPLRHTALFAAFDGEELGLQGSAAFVRQPPLPLSSVALDINLDMVSRNDRNEIFAAGTSHFPWLRPIIEDVQRRSAVKILFGHDRPMLKAGMVEDWTMQSDHGSLFRAGVPFVYFGVEDHPDYHQPGDTADKVDPVFFTNVVNMLIDAVVTLDEKVE